MIGDKIDQRIARRAATETGRARQVKRSLVRFGAEFNGLQCVQFPDRITGLLVSTIVISGFSMRSILSLAILFAAASQLVGCTSQPPTLPASMYALESAPPMITAADESATAIAGVRGSDDFLLIDLWCAKLPRTVTQEIGVMLRNESALAESIDARTMDGEPITLRPWAPARFVPGTMINYAAPESVQFSDHVLIQIVQTESPPARKLQSLQLRLTADFVGDTHRALIAHVDTNWRAFEIERAKPK